MIGRNPVRVLGGIAVAGILAIVVVGLPRQLAPEQAAAEPAAAGAGEAVAVPSAPPEVAYRGNVRLEPTAGPTGTSVSVVGTGFQADEELAVVWNTVRGTWKLGGADRDEFLGRAFEPRTEPLGRAVVGSDGAFRTTFKAPRDFGFSHDVTVESAGTIVNKAAYRLEPTVTVTPSSGPAGTPIRIRVEGVGWQFLENSWAVIYDNRYTGLLTAVTTAGLAEATIPAVGDPGKHFIRIAISPFQMPYLTEPPNPRPDLPVFDVAFTITDGRAVQPAPPERQSLAAEPGTEPAGSGPAIWTSLASAPVGTPLTIDGRGFASGSEVALGWVTVVGSRVSAAGWQEETSQLGTVRAGPDGRFSLPIAAPDDLGGAHRIEALGNEAVLATATFTITPAVVSVTPSSGPAGTEIFVHLNGVGWTETANIYHVVYDNGYVGYACGFPSQGHMKVRLPAAGAPGWHFIDLYPGIYKGEDDPGVSNFRIPQLTYAADHPGERLPAFRFAFEIKGSTP